MHIKQARTGVLFDLGVFILIFKERFLSGLNQETVICELVSCVISETSELLTDQTLRNSTQLAQTGLSVRCPAHPDWSGYITPTDTDVLMYEYMSEHVSYKQGLSSNKETNDTDPTKSGRVGRKSTSEKTQRCFIFSHDEHNGIVYFKLMFR